jgi:hypothetical protein
MLRRKRIAPPGHRFKGTIFFLVAFFPLFVGALFFFLLSLTLGVGVLVLCDRKLRIEIWSGLMISDLGAAWLYDHARPPGPSILTDAGRI